MCWPVHSLMPIDPHPEEKWLQWFEIRSQKPYNYNAASSTMICASKYTTYHWIDKPMFSQLSWTDDQPIDTLAKLTECEVTVLSVVPCHGDLEEYVKKRQQYQLMLNDVCLVVVDNECTCCVWLYQGKENILHDVQWLVTSTVLRRLATVTHSSDAESRPLLMKRCLVKSWNYVERNLASCMKW